MKRIVVPSSPKDSSGAYLPVGPAAPSEKPAIHKDLSVDDLLKQGLLGIQRVLRGIMHEIAQAEPSPPEREIVMSLKDTMAMLHELKKKESELLEDLTDEQLKALVIKE